MIHRIPKLVLFYIREFHFFFSKFNQTPQLQYPLSNTFPFLLPLPNYFNHLIYFCSSFFQKTFIKNLLCPRSSYLIIGQDPLGHFYLQRISTQQGRSIYHLCLNVCLKNLNILFCEMMVVQLIQT